LDAGGGGGGSRRGGAGRAVAGRCRGFFLSACLDTGFTGWDRRGFLDVVFFIKGEVLIQARRPTI
jgi:hypothetical protein